MPATPERTGASRRSKYLEDLIVGNPRSENYILIDKKEGIRLFGSTSCWDDLTGSMIARRLESTLGKLKYKYAENSIEMESGGVITDNKDRLIFNYQKPHGAKADSEMRLHAHFEQTSTNKIVFTTQYRIQRSFGIKTTAWTTVTANTDDNCVEDYPGSGTFNQIIELAQIDLSDYPISSTVQFRVARTDTTTGSIFVTFMDAHIEYDGFGSEDEYDK